MAHSTTEPSLKAVNKGSAEDSSAGLPSMRLPFGGELLRAPEKRFHETVVIVPFYGGRKMHLRRHADLFLSLGYDVCWFDLRTAGEILPQYFFSSAQEAGVKHIWADQIEAILNGLPGQKIVFAMSSPCASAIEAIARRGCVDVRGLICDSGPSNNLFASMINFFKYEQPVKFYPARIAAALAMSIAWSPQFRSIVHEDLAKLPKNYKILSIRGWKDRIIAVGDIDRVFEPHAQLDWRKLSLPKADHLNGLRDYPEEYTKPVADFLKKISTPMEEPAARASTGPTIAKDTAAAAVNSAKKSRHK